MKSPSHIKETELQVVVEKSASAKGSNTNCSLCLLFSFSSIIPSSYWNLMANLAAHGSLLLHSQLITEAGAGSADMSMHNISSCPTPTRFQSGSRLQIALPALMFKTCVGSRTGDPSTLPEPFPKQRTAPSCHQGDGRER